MSVCEEWRNPSAEVKNVKIVDELENFCDRLVTLLALPQFIVIGYCAYIDCCDITKYNVVTVSHNQLIDISDKISPYL